MDCRHVKDCRAGLGAGTIPGVEYKDRRGRFAARSQELLGEDLDEAREADGVLVEERHDAQTQALLHLHRTNQGLTTRKPLLQSEEVIIKVLWRSMALLYLHRTYQGLTT